jgi:hypothetical protein
MFILFTSKFRHSSSIAKTTIFMNNKVDSKKTFEELLKYLSSQNSNVAKRIWHKYFGWGVLVWVLVLKNIPVGYDMRKYHPCTSTSLIWDVRSYQVYAYLIPVSIPGLYLLYTRQNSVDTSIMRKPIYITRLPRVPTSPLFVLSPPK